MRNDKIYSIESLPLAALKTIENDEVWTSRLCGRAPRVKKTRVYLFGGPDEMTSRQGRKIVQKILSARGAAMGIPADVKVTFSQKAGCSCGCSPGFVLDHQTNFEIFADLVQK